MYTRILVPLDGSKLAEQVVPYVRLFGKSLHSSIELLRVVDTGLPGIPHPAHAVRPHLYVVDMISHARSYLDGIEESLGNAGASLSAIVKHGSPAACIVNEAEKEPATLVAMSTHGRCGLSRWVFGSVSAKVLHASTFPLLIVCPSEKGKITEEINLKSIIVPLDGSPTAERVLPHVVGLAKSLGLTTTLVRATFSKEDYYRYMAYQPLDSVSTAYYGPYEEFSEETDAQAMKYLHDVGLNLRSQGAMVQERLLHGPTAGAIANMADETPGSLVAMTTHGRTGVRRWILGSVTDQVVRHGGGPVLVVRAVSQAPERTTSGTEEDGVPLALR